MDETADCRVKKQCAHTIIYICNLRNKIITRFFDMVEIWSDTANALHNNCLKDVIMKNKIPFSNTVGFSSDTTNYMFGEHHSAISLLKTEFPNNC
jgi:hypothetical protein